MVNILKWAFKISTRLCIIKFTLSFLHWFAIQFIDLLGVRNGSSQFTHDNTPLMGLCPPVVGHDWSVSSPVGRRHPDVATQPACPGTVGVPGQAAVGALGAVELTLVQPHLGHAHLRAHVQLLLWAAQVSINVIFNTKRFFLHILTLLTPLFYYFCKGNKNM